MYIIKINVFVRRRMERVFFALDRFWETGSLLRENTCPFYCIFRNDFFKELGFFS